MLLTVQILVVLLYLTLVLELTVFHVPSVASSLNIWNPKEDILQYYSRNFADIFRIPKWKKFCLFVLPLCVVYLTYFFPIFLFFQPKIDLALVYTPNFVLQTLGIVCMLIGRFITFSSVLTIRKHNQQKEDSFTLHTNGKFSRMRNPGLVGLYLFLFGIWCSLPSLYFLIGIVLYAVYMHFKVLMEEDFLTNRYGEDYKQYFIKTNRYF